MVFKEAEGRIRSGGCDAVRLYMGTTSNIYSVRFRDEGPDYRGLIQVVNMQVLRIVVNMI